jgi:hypothetical protein
MRTTVRIDHQLLSEAKALAAASGRTLDSVVEDALREKLTRTPARGSDRPIKLPTFSGGQLRSGVDLDDTASLLDLMERSSS